MYLLGCFLCILNFLFNPNIGIFIKACEFGFKGFLEVVIVPP